MALNRVHSAELNAHLSLEMKSSLSSSISLCAAEVLFASLSMKRLLNASELFNRAVLSNHQQE
jgi:hypothetical protein